jgi:hypothetical protein
MDHFEDAVLSLDQLGLDAELLFDLVRQTGGTGSVVSNNTVFDGQHETLRRRMLSACRNGTR